MTSPAAYKTVFATAHSWFKTSIGKFRKNLKTQNFEFPRNRFLGKALPRKTVNSTLLGMTAGAVTSVARVSTFLRCWRHALLFMGTSGS